jgi:hypothetical protein
MREQARAEMKLVIALEDRGILVVISSRNTVVRDRTDGLLGNDLGLRNDRIILYPGGNIAYRKLVLVERLLEDMCDSQKVRRVCLNFFDLGQGLCNLRSQRDLNAVELLCKS